MRCVFFGSDFFVRAISSWRRIDCLLQSAFMAYWCFRLPESKICAKWIITMIFMALHVAKYATTDRISNN
jgi:hypothetical protein